MGIALIITRSHDEDFEQTGEEISREQWLTLVEQDPDLEIRTEPHELRNPSTGEVIRIPARDAETELRTPDGKVPFLAYAQGDLVMGYAKQLESPDDPVRKKIAAIARGLGALITHDAGPEILRW